MKITYASCSRTLPQCGTDNWARSGLPSTELFFADHEANSIASPKGVLKAIKYKAAQEKMRRGAELVEQAQSPWSFRLVLILKEYGSWHFYVDYGRLSSTAIRDATRFHAVMSASNG